jgi:hypothetical protein
MTFCFIALERKRNKEQAQAVGATNPSHLFKQHKEMSQEPIMGFVF